MKATFVAAAAAVLVGGVSAGMHNYRHIHHEIFERRGHNESEVCVPGCTTIYTTITGPAGLYIPPATATPTNSTTSVYVTSTALPTTSTSSTPATVPTPMAQTCPTPGVYTFPATTVVITETATVCAASTTTVSSGTHTLGGVTTVVETATTVVCPYATTSTSSGVVTSVIKTTTYVCPSAGTYTIAPITTTVTGTATVVPVPVISTYTPGTYTAPAVVTTITETDYVVYCPFSAQESSTSASTAPISATSSAKVAIASTSSAAVATTTASSSSNSSSSGLGGSGGMWAITYTPYTESGSCKSASDVLTDITSIKGSGFTTVRVYSTDCDTLPNVGSACASVGLKMILGIFINEAGCDDSSISVSEQVSDIASWAQWDLVELVAVGNEAMFNEYCSPSQLASLITTVKSTFGAAGYTGLYTTTDVVSAWQDNDVTAICEAIDVVATNAHAYFNSETLPEAAGAFVAGQLAIVEAICNLPGYVLESGWPTQGDCIGEACASTENQAAALSSIKETCGDKVVFFTFGLDLWKDVGSCNCEPWFDCSSFFSETETN